MSRFTNRIPAAGKDGRIKIKNVVTSGNEITGILEHADDAAVQGTLLNADNLNQMEADLKAYTDNAVSEVSENYNKVGAVPLTGGVMTGPLSVPRPLVINSSGGDNDDVRLIKAYRQTALNYINFGYSPSINNCGELMFNYSSNGSDDNYSELSLYGGYNRLRVHPNKTESIKPIYEAGARVYSPNNPPNFKQTIKIGEANTNNAPCRLYDNIQNYIFLLFKGRMSNGASCCNLIPVAAFAELYTNNDNRFVVSNDANYTGLYYVDDWNLYRVNGNFTYTEIFGIR